MIDVSVLNKLTQTEKWKKAEQEWLDRLGDGCLVLPIELGCKYHQAERKKQIKEFFNE